MDQSREFADGASDPLYQVLEAKYLGSDGVENSVRFAAGLTKRKVREILYKDGLHFISPGTWNCKYRNMLNEPGDVVDEDVFGAEDHRGPKDRVRQAGFDDCFLNLRLTGVIR